MEQILDFERFFQKGELIPAVVQEPVSYKQMDGPSIPDWTGRACGSRWKPDTPGFTAVPARNSGIRARLPDIFRRCCPFTPTVMTTPFW